MVRASDDTREHTVAELRSGLSSGRLGLDTFVRRVDEAYDAKTRGELSHLTRDLPSPRAWWRKLVGELGGRHGAAAPLCPPALEPGAAVTLGRAPDCDYVVRDATVSARHAELRRTADGWSLRDLGSRNGTRLNGWLVSEREISDGDELTLGGAVFSFREPG